MQYSLYQAWKKAVHGSDLLSTFWNSDVDYYESLQTCFDVGKGYAWLIAQKLKKFAPPYQSYFASHAVTGDPNKNAIVEAKSHDWQPASVTDGSLTNVMNADGQSPFFTDITDATNNKTTCDFWKGIAAAIQPASGSAENLGLMVQDASVRGSNEL